MPGMNDVLNSQGYTQSAWWNRIPGTAWVLMVAIALGCNLLIGHSAHRTERDSSIFSLVWNIFARWGNHQHVPSPYLLVSRRAE
jgi:hypothetical protein